MTKLVYLSYKVYISYVDIRTNQYKHLPLTHRDLSELITENGR